MFDYNDIDNYEEQESYEEDRDAALAQKELEEQRRWEEENDVATILSNDPGYTAWAEEMDRQTAEDREILALADIEAERSFSTTSQPWD
jgi:hypothetical protein